MTENYKPEPGDLIPMSESQAEFLKVRGKFIDNPEMERAMALQPKHPKVDMEFSTSARRNVPPQVTAEDSNCLQAIHNKKFTCKQCGKETTAKYELVLFRKEVSHHRTGSKELDHLNNLMDLKHFGRKIRSCFHIIAKCRGCGAFLQFVKQTGATRRAAGELASIRDR